MDKHDPTQLTEFPRFEPEVPQNSVTTFFNKFLKLPIFSSESNQATPQIAETSQNTETPLKSESDNTDEKISENREIQSYPEELEGRSLPNVLRRISSLVISGSGGGTKYEDTELARYWMPDEVSRECYECGMRFSTLRRRHHCRVCGQIFCSRCCSQRVPGHIFGCVGGLRVCNYCCNVVLSYLRENDVTGDMAADLKTLQEDLQIKFPLNEKENESKLDFTFSSDQVEKCDTKFLHTNDLYDVYTKLSYALPTQAHRYKLARYEGVWRGCDMLQWVMENTENKTRVQAGVLCQSLVTSGFVQCVCDLTRFADYALYRPTVGVIATNNNSGLTESSSSYSLDLNVEDSSARLSREKKQVTVNITAAASDEENTFIEHVEGSSENRQVSKAIVELGEDHLKLLMRQCLSRESLSSSWLDVLYPLCQRAAEVIMPDMMSAEIDVRSYVQVKKVAGGEMKDSRLIQGVVLTKNVAHRGMPQQISKPSILLLDCSIDYQRVEGKLTSLEPLLLQEREYVARCAARVVSLGARVVLARGGVARAAGDALRRAGAALAVRVGSRALRRVARCARAHVVTSVDARIATPKLGACEMFYTIDFPSKTLMVLEDCAAPNLGCCILLRGGSIQELVKVKKVAKFMLLACYNWKLEKALLADLEAVLDPGMAFVDEDEETFEDSKTSPLNPKDKDGTVKNNDTEQDNIHSVSEDKLEDTNDFSESGIPIDDENITTLSNETVNDTQAENVVDTIKDENGDSLLNDPKSNETFERAQNAAVTESNAVNLELQEHKIFRKQEVDKNLSYGVPIKDFSDPLHALTDEKLEDNKLEDALEATIQSERWSADDVILTVSPNVRVPPPPPHCGLPRSLAPRAPLTPRAALRKQSKQETDELFTEPHPFVTSTTISMADEPETKAALANFRATGCRLAHTKHKPNCYMYDAPLRIKTSDRESDTKTDERPLDPFAPENHQKLNLLLYSYSNKSANVPDFCVNPWIATMELYGHHDISLGAFLQKFCFDSEYKCPSRNCLVPMNQHVRRFVHGDACITLTCNTIGHSNTDKMKEERAYQVTVWSSCSRCGSGPARAATRLALGLSLAQYARLRALPPRGLRSASCPHPLHSRAHHFMCRATATTATFRCNKISKFKIIFPPDVIKVSYEPSEMRSSLINQLNDLMLRAHEMFSSATDGEADKDYQVFKQQMDQIHLALTSSSLQEDSTVAGVVRKLWRVGDRIIGGEKLLREAQDKWAAASKTARPQPENAPTTVESDLEDSSCDDSTDTSNKETEKEILEEDEEKGDKKTVRQILSQLLSNNQPSNQAGIIMMGGAVPVAVRAGEVGSVVAATLASLTYQRTLRQYMLASQMEQEDAETNVKEKSDSDKTKPSKNNDHIEVLLKDGLLCRVYFASQFHRLRHALLAPLDARSANKCGCEQTRDADKSVCETEEGYVRSVARCVPWAARGGKSGSTFCKTTDDRYVLKEMTKPEWQQFLEFAPHYFSYVIGCRQNNQRTLLARIVGCYSVGGAGNGVLVMENVWYRAGDAARYDLKGSARHRAAPAAHAAPHDEPHPVHNDDDMLHMRWERQLYVADACARALCECVSRDTAFLCARDVMDYSLLLAVGPGTLTVGLVDYIRTFTWDKKLEHLVKKNLGSGQPTVVSPDQYRRRFMAACRNYFLQCPDHWHHLDSEPVDG